MLACPCCGKRGMRPATLRRLDELRHLAGVPFNITSGYRCPQYNRRISSTGSNGPHTTGQAVDVHLVGAEVYEVLPLLKTMGFTGIGLDQNGDHKGRFLHLDDLKDHETKGPRPWVWTY